MPLNRYFVTPTYQNSPEQKLLEDIWTECIKITGTDAFYIIRNDTNVDLIYGEDPLKTFSNAFPIEVYNTDTSDFEGMKEIFSKFGEQLQNEYTVLMSRRSFLQQVQYDPRYGRPKEGDLLWVPHVRGQGVLFEITFVNPEKDMFALQRRYPYFYEIKLEPFKYSQEMINTGVPGLDGIVGQDAWTESFALNHGGTGQYIINETIYQGASLAAATASAFVVSWNNPTYTLNVTNTMGSFATNQSVIGSVSGAVYTLTTYDSFGIEIPQEPQDNERILDEALLYEVFDVTPNPLGQP